MDGPSDAVRTLNRTRAYVANFRQAPDITVSFGAAAYTATEGGTAATVAVQLSAAPTRTIEIPLSWTAGTGATAGTAYDFGGVPAAVRFGATDTESTFTVTAVDDAADENDETITLTFGDLAARGVTEGSQSETTVTLVDDANDTLTAAPSILRLEVTSDPGPDRLYAAGDVIEVSVRFDKTVAVTGSPQIELTVGGGTRQATYRDSAGEVVRFTYTVTTADGGIGRVSIAANSLTPNSGTIRDGDEQDASLSHDAVEGRPYDTDSDGLIEITTVAQLDAVRYDLNGDGDPTTTGAATYRAAFPGDDTPLSCVGGCEGYELAADLDLDTNGNGMADSGDAYWNNGQRLGADRCLQPPVAQKQSLRRDLRRQRPHDCEPVHRPYRFRQLSGEGAVRRHDFVRGHPQRRACQRRRVRERI